jgi:hypothetical protein
LNPFQLIGGSLSGHYLMLTDDISAVQSSFRPCTPFSQLDRIVHPQSIVSCEESLMHSCLNPVLHSFHALVPKCACSIYPERLAISKWEVWLAERRVEIEPSS